MGGRVKKKKRNNEKPNVRLKAGGEGIRGWPAATLEAWGPRMEVRGARQKGDGGGVALWSHLIFLVWGEGHNETTKKSKNEKTKK